MPTKQTSLAEVLAVVGKEKREGKHRCPACLKWNLVVSEKGGKVLTDCKTPGCAKGAAWEVITANRASPIEQSEKAAPWPGLTVADFAKQKGLPLSLLSYFGVYDTTYPGKNPAHKGKPVVAFPYGMELNGKWVQTGTKVRGGAEKQFEWVKGEHGKHIAAPYGLCIPFLTNSSDLVLCEGESDTLTLAAYGIPALGISGADNWKREFTQLAPIRNAERIFIIQEPDDAGPKFVKAVSEDISPEKIYIVPFPGDAPDPNALHKNCLKLEKTLGPIPWFMTATQDRTLAESKEIVAHRRELLKSGEWDPRADDHFLREFDALIADAKPIAGSYTLRSMADVQMKAVEWLWPGRVPLGKLTIFAGQPGSGKSMVACSLAGIVTKGLPFPDSPNPNENEPMDVLMLYSEDEAEDTVAPRLKAAGADLRRVHDVKISVPNGGSDEERHIAFDRDRTLLEKILRDNPKIKLVIVDPITSFIGDINMNKGQEVRDVLIPLKELATRTGVTFVLIAHFNKRSDVSALNKILGAVDLAAVCRAAWLFTEDESEDAKGQYLMLYGKMNIARKAGGLEYTIEEKDVESLKGIPFIKWGDRTEVSASQVMGLFGPMEKGKSSKVDKAIDWLRGALSQGKKSADTIKGTAAQAGIKERTLNTAKERLGIESVREGTAWYWLPPTSGDSEE